MSHTSFKVFLLISAFALSACNQLGLNLNDSGSLNPALGKLVLPAPNVEELNFSNLKSTVYYTPEFDVRNPGCDSRRPIYSASGEVITEMCPKDYSTCLMEGSCRIQDSGESYLITVVRASNGQTIFAKSSIEECPYGKGIQNRCLDPFFTVAADPNYFKAGDVIFVKEVRGLLLPDGSMHSGYFIVRDVGAAIKGSNRFDFFSGSLNPADSQNPFRQIGLSYSNKFHFAEVTGELAERVRKDRNF